MTDTHLQPFTFDFSEDEARKFVLCGTRIINTLLNMKQSDQTSFGFPSPLKTLKKN